MGWMIWATIGLPALLALGCLGASGRNGARALSVSGIAAGVLVLVFGLALIPTVDANGPVLAASGILRVDSLSAYMLAVVGAVAVTATWGGYRATQTPFDATAERLRADRHYAALVCVFLSAMSLALVSDDLGIMWVAVEATTITTAFLVGHHGGRRALEAAWKYVVLGSVGVAIAFLGIVLLYGATAATSPTLSWVRLVSDPPDMNPDLVRLAVALAALGFATKAGLAPMHSWLPDAHSQAPAPVSGLMSGVLLSVAFYAILRVKAISDAVLGPGLMRGMLLAAGLLSLGIAAALILGQRDYKRMLAYSSIEHMGLLCLGAAAGTQLALAAVLLHILGHGLGKASMFVVSGRILAAHASSRIADVRGLLAGRPDLGVPWLLGMAALLGFPPFSLFFTEVAIIVAGWQAGLGVAMGLALVLLLVAFAGLARHTLAMSLGPAQVSGSAAGSSPPGQWGPAIPLAVSLGTTAVVGFAVPLATVLAGAVAALGVLP